MYIKSVKYKIDKDSKWKSGISLECDGDMNGRILSDSGDIIDVIYDVKDVPDILINFAPILKNIDDEHTS